MAVIRKRMRPRRTQVLKGPMQQRSMLPGLGFFGSLGAYSVGWISGFLRFLTRMESDLEASEVAPKEFTEDIVEERRSEIVGLRALVVSTWRLKLEL